MEKLHNIVAMNRGLNLPIGYRFRPTDEELVVHYLKKKVLSLPLPASVIPEFDVFRIDPLALPGDVKEKRYFFCNKRKGNDGVNIISVVGQKKRAFFGSGYWKPIGKDRLILASDDPNRGVGLRRTMVFCQGKRFSDTNTRWLMHEYHLVRSGPTLNSIHLVSGVERNEHWVVCGVFQKKRRSIKRMRNKMVLKKRVEEMSNSGPSTQKISCSSGITEVTSQPHGLDYDQQQNSAIHVGCFR